MKQSVSLLSAFLFMTFSFANAAFAQTVVVPNAFESAEAPAGNTIPFGTDFFCDNGIRYQQVYADAQVSETGAVTTVRFRLDGEELDLLPSSVYGGASVSISTAANGPTSFSETFAENIGPDVVEVFAGDLTLSAPGGSASPKPFDVEIAFQSPFIYLGGDLLLDISIRSCADPGISFDRPDGSDVSLTRRITATGVNTSSADTGVGLVTRFQFGPLPDEVFSDRFEN